MLRTTRPRSRACEPFVCYRCLSSLGPGRHDRGRLLPPPLWSRSSKPSPSKLSRSFSAHCKQRATDIRDVSLAPPESSDLPSPDTARTRLQVIEGVRKWETEYASTFSLAGESPIRRAAQEFLNTMTKGAVDSSICDPDDDLDEHLDTPIFSRDDLLDVGAGRQFLRPGDLVELPTGSQTPLLAIFTRRVGFQSQFYTIQSGWVQGVYNSPLFRVPHFVEPCEVAGLLPYLPDAEVPAELVYKLNMMDRRVPTGIGQSLLRKMHNFLDQSDSIYRANSAALDSCHARLAHPRDFRHYTLLQIAGLLLPETITKTEAPSPALHAVHRAISMNDAGFKSPLKFTVTAGGYYEILPRADLIIIEHVRKVVREYVNNKLAESSGAPPPKRNLLDRFVRKSQRYIDFSRKSRSFTSYGSIVSIHTTPADWPDASDFDQLEAFDEGDKMIIKFLELWAAFRSIHAWSTLNAIGSTILRAIKRYDDSTEFNHEAGWTLLQEIGIVPPWEALRSYDLRLPKTGLRLSALPREPSKGFVPDRLKGLRHDWGDLPVYCIDDSGAHEIDDGISIEATDSPNEYWLHIHIADPGAHIDPSGEAANYAEALTSSVYMPDRVTNMLSREYVQANLSLGNNRPCLTYSAKMSTDGELLDYKITPGIVRKVLHITPRTVHEAIRKSTYPLKTRSHVVGQNMTEPIRNSTIKLRDLSDRDKENLELLDLIGKAILRQRQARGGYHVGVTETKVAVSMEGIQKSHNGISTYYRGDPAIRVYSTAVDNPDPITEDGGPTDVVSPLMILAGEIAARWCRDRGLPILYRLTPRRSDTANPGEFFAKNIIPMIEKRIPFDSAVMRSYYRLIGAAQSSSTPGPHMSMGVEMFARSTSPLRRFPDLVLQWQVEAAILEEARLGKSLVGNTQDDFLPFSRARIDALIPYVDAKEKLTARNIKTISHWFALFILRASFFGQADVPKSFSMVVMDINTTLNTVNGVLSHLGMVVPSYCSICPLTEIQVGDVLEVEPNDINIKMSLVLFKAIKRLDQSEREALDRKNLLMMESQEII